MTRTVVVLGGGLSDKVCGCFGGCLSDKGCVGVWVVV